MPGTKTMVSVLREELEYKVEKLEGHAAEDQEQFWTSSWWINHPGSVHTEFYNRDWLIQSIINLLVKSNKGEGRGAEKGGGLIKFFPLKRGGGTY